MKKNLIILFLCILPGIVVYFPALSATIYRYKIHENDVAELNKLSNSLNLAGKKGWPVTAGEVEKIDVLGVAFINTDTLKRTVGNDEIVTYVQKVQSIMLEGQGLTGTLPSISLGELTRMTLNLNNISGNIPTLNLPKCTWLILANNQFSGSIPNFNLPVLETLALHNNKLTGSIPNFNLPLLTGLLLSDNQLQGTLPNFNFPRLQIFNAYNNQITGNLPAYNFPELYHLDLQNNQISGPIPLLNLPKAQDISLNNNKLSGSIPDLSFPVIDQLYIQKNSLDGTIGKLNAPKLKIFDATDNKLTGDFDNSQMTSLSHLKLNNNNITGLPKLSSLSPNITLVEVKGCRLTFEDFELNMDIPLFYMDNQQRVETYEGLMGIKKILYVKVGGTKNKYQWIKGKDGKTSEIVGATDDTLLVTPEAGASFMCRITNEIVKTLTFYSKPITPAMCLKAGVFEFCIEQGEWKPKSLNTLENTGRVSINNTFVFEGTMSVDTLNLDMKAVGDFYFRNIPLPGGTRGNYMISQGEHNLKLLGKDGIITNFLNSKLTYTAKLCDIAVKIDSLRLIKRKDTLGVQISSTIQIPFLFKGCDFPDNTEIRLKNFEVHNFGWSVGGFYVENLGFVKQGFCLSKLTYDNDREKNTLIFGAEADLPWFIEELHAGFKLKNGEIDSIALLVDKEKSIPIKPPGLGLKGVYGHIAGLTKANSLISRDLTKLDFKLGGILAPAFEVPEESPVKPEDLFKAYIDGRVYYPKLAKFTATGNMFKPPATNGIYILPYQIIYGGEILWKIPEAQFELEFNGKFGTLDEKNYLMDITGKCVIECVYSPIRYSVTDEGFITLPKYTNDFPFDWLDTYLDFPVKLRVASIMSSADYPLKHGIISFQPTENQTYNLGFIIDFSKKLFSSGYLTFTFTADPRIATKNKSASLVAETTKIFTVENNSDFFVIKVKSPLKATASSLKDPAGKIYKTTNQGDKVLFSKSSDEKEVFWSVLDPKPGNWTINLESFEENDTAFIYRQLKKEDFNFNVSQVGKTVTVQWDSTAIKIGKNVSFMFDEDMTGFDGRLIAEGSAKAGKLSFTIDDSFSKCRYYVYGRLIGDYWTSQNYSNKQIDNQNSILAPPANFSSAYNKTTGKFDFTWIPNSSPDVEGYVLTLKDASGRDSVCSVLSRNTSNISLTIKNFESKKAIIETYGPDGKVGCSSDALDLVTNANEIGLNNHASASFEVFPNPSGNTCTIRFDVGKQSKCDVTVYDIEGRLIDHPVSGFYPEGTYQTDFHYRNLQHGIYLFRFTNNNETIVIKSVYGR